MNTCFIKTDGISVPAVNPHNSLLEQKYLCATLEQLMEWTHTCAWSGCLVKGLDPQPFDNFFYSFIKSSKYK
jgi:hypothetical protein